MTKEGGISLFSKLFYVNSEEEFLSQFKYHSESVSSLRECAKKSQHEKKTKPSLSLEKKSLVFLLDFLGFSTFDLFRESLEILGGRGDESSYSSFMFTLLSTLSES